MTTRAEFFAGLRAELARARLRFPARVAERPAHPALVAETLRRELSERWAASAERFRDEFERVGGVFHRVGRIGDVPGVVGAIARGRQARRLVTWHPTVLGADFGADLGRQGLQIEVMPAGLPAEGERAGLRTRIASAEIGLTGADVAIAETGTLVLVSGAGRPRSTALLPACHVAVFGRTALIESLQQMGVVLEAWHAADTPGDRGAAIHFITGPSRTADIELTLTRGVHGPGEVHAIFVDTPWHG
jgi:L-lactate dehydrogenase complex protein LldG